MEKTRCQNRHNEKRNSLEYVCHGFPGLAESPNKVQSKRSHSRAHHCWADFTCGSLLGANLIV